MNKILCFFFLMIFGISFCYANSDLPDRVKRNYENGVVVEVLSHKNNKELSELLKSQQIGQLLRVKILSGDLKDQEFTVENQLTSNPEFDIDVKEGDRVLLSVERFFKDYQVYVAAKDRSSVIIFLVSFFFLLLLVIGGIRGLRTIISVLVSCFMLFILFLFILNGMNPIFLTFIILAISAFILKFILNGVNICTITAALSSSLTLALCAVFSIIFVSLSDLNGFHCEEAVILHSLRPFLSNKEILMASMMIALFGALLHICSGISCKIAEEKQKSIKTDFKNLFQAGMICGKESVMTMSSIFLYAYAGLMIFLFLMLCEIPFLKFINLNSVVIIIVNICIAGISLVLSIPVSSLIGAWLVNRFSR